MANYRGFLDRGFRIVCIFDNDPNKIGQAIGEHRILPFSDLQTIIIEQSIKVAMIAVPASHAQEVANTLIESGVRALLNYAPISLNVPEEVHVQYIDPVVHLQRMTYYLD